MIGYSKIKIIGTNKSRSMDFTDLLSAPQSTTKEPNNTRAANANPIALKTQENAEEKEEEDQQKQTIKKPESAAETKSSAIINGASQDGEFVVEQDDDDDEERVTNYNGDINTSFGAVKVKVIHRNSSVSSSASAALQSAVKRAFSMRRSSSVSERYSRIHDQSVTLASPFDDDDEMVETTRSVKKKHSSFRILKACKRLFGL